MTNDWHDRDASIECRANANRRQDQLEHCEMNVPKEHNQANEEQEQGNVEKRGQHFDCPWKEKLLNIIGKEPIPASGLLIVS